MILSPKLAIVGALETNQYYSQYKEEKPWVSTEAKNGSPSDHSNLSSPGKNSNRKMDIEAPGIKKENSGADFIDYVNNRFKIKNPKVLFEKIPLSTFIEIQEENASPAMLYVNKADAANEEHIITKIFQDEEVYTLAVFIEFKTEPVFQTDRDIVRECRSRKN